MPYPTPDTPPADAYVCWRLRFPDTLEFRMIVNAALSTIIYHSSFFERGSLSVEDTAQYFKRMFMDREADTCMIGAIIPIATATYPTGILPCDGGTYQRADYPLLYDLLDPAFIVDTNQFMTPDLRGRSVIGTGSGFLLTAYSLGDTGGLESVTLDETQIPPHSHSYTPPTVSPVIQGELVPDPFTAHVGFPALTGSAGGGQAHENRPPYLALHYGIIAR